MSGLIIITVIVFTVAVGASMALTNFVGALLYDIRETKQRRTHRSHPFSRSNRQRPLISVIISTHNNEMSIGRCLNALVKSSYRKYEIIVVDHASQDKTKSVVKDFGARYPKKTIRLVARKTLDKQITALNQAYKRYGHGPLVIVLDGSSYLDPQALKNAVQSLNAEPDIAMLLPNHKIASSLTVTGLFQSYRELLGGRAKKFSSVAQAARAVDGRGLVCRADSFRALIKPVVRKAKLRNNLTNLWLPADNKEETYLYAQNVVIYSEPADSLYQLGKQTYASQLNRWRALSLGANANTTHQRFLTWFYRPLAAGMSVALLFLPILTSYFIYLALKLQEPTLLAVSAAILAIFLLSAIWDDNTMKIQQKVEYTLGIPITYGLFFLLACSQLFILFRTAVWPIPTKTPKFS